MRISHGEPANEQQLSTARTVGTGCGGLSLEQLENWVENHSENRSAFVDTAIEHFVPVRFTVTNENDPALVGE